MATYGYSTPFSNFQQNLPQGYMEAATAPGRNLAAGIVGAGANIGQLLNKYEDHREQNQFYDQKIKDMIGMAAKSVGSGNIMDSSTPESGLLKRIMDITGAENGQDLVDKGSKISAMPLAKKKAIAADLAFSLDRYDRHTEQAGARMAQDLQNQEMMRRMSAEDEAKQQNALITQGLGYALQNSSRQVQQPVTQQVPVYGQGEPLPQLDVPAPAASQGEQTMALRNRLAATTQALPQLQRYLGQLDSQISSLKVAASPTLLQKRSDAPEGFNNTMGYESPVEAAQRSMAAVKQLPPLLAERDNIAKQVQALSSIPDKPGKLGTVKADQAGPTMKQVGTQSQQVGTQTVTQPVPYEEQRKGVMSYLAKSGARADTLAMADKILSIAGQERPLQMESQLDPKSGATVIRADGKIEVIQPPKPVEGKPLTEVQSKAVGFASSMMLNEDTIKKLDDAGYTGANLSANTWSPELLKSEDRKVYETAKDNWVGAVLRFESGAAITEHEYEIAKRQYFPVMGDTPKVLAQKKELRDTKTKSIVTAIGPNAGFYLGQVHGATSAMSAPTDEASTIRAAYKSGKLSREQAVKQLNALGIK